MNGTNRAILSEATAKAGKDAFAEYAKNVTGNAVKAASTASIPLKRNGKKSK